MSSSILRGKPAKLGKKGVSVSVTKEADPEHGVAPLEHEDRKEKEIPWDPSLPEHPAYVGTSVSAGMKSKFARESIDVSSWCTLPCDITPEARADAFEEARHICIEETVRTMNKTLDEFFPDFGEAAEED